MPINTPFKPPHPLPAPQQLKKQVVHTTDAVLKKTQDTTHTTDAHLVDRITKTHTTDARVVDLRWSWPDTDVVATGWDSAPTPSQSLYAQVDEDPYSDTDYIYPT